MSKNLKVLANFQSLSEKEDLLKEILIDLMNKSREEEGCTGFELLQKKTDPTSFTFIEEWESENCFSAHLEVSHLFEAKKKLKNILAENQEILIYDIVT